MRSSRAEKRARGFAIDPKGRFLVANEEKSDTISVYSIDQSSGALKLLQNYSTWNDDTGGSKGLHGHQLPEMDVPRFFNGQPLPDPFQHQRLFLRKTITLVILPEE